MLSIYSVNHHLNQTSWSIKHFKSVVQIRGNTKFDMYWWHLTWSHRYSIILAPQRLSCLTKKEFWRKLSGHNSRRTSKGMSINKSARAWTSLKTNANVSNFMTCARKNHWRSWVHLQRLRCAIDIYGYYKSWTQLWLNPSIVWLLYRWHQQERGKVITVNSIIRKLKDVSCKQDCLSCCLCSVTN